MLGVLKKVDSTFRIRKSQKYTGVNKGGFEVDIIRRERAGDEDDDSWVVQARRANVLLDAPGFSVVIVASNGSMARMDTVHPATFVAFKRWMAAQPEREALKRRRDGLQADAVQVLLEQYLPPAGSCPAAASGGGLRTPTRCCRFPARHSHCRRPETIRQHNQRPLMREGRLTMTNPQEPNDPQQAYRAVGRHQHIRCMPKEWVRQRLACLSPRHGDQ
jgi:hypothetical protein